MDQNYLCSIKKNNLGKGILNFRNRKITDKKNILKFCTKNLKLHNIHLFKELGSGSYGTVYKFHAKVSESNGIFSEKTLDNLDSKCKKCSIDGDTYNIALKEIISKKKDLNKEVIYSYYMAESNIGPEIYDAFYIEERGKIIQYILMEPMDTSASDLFESKKYLDNIKIETVKQMINILTMQTLIYDMHCSDISLNNFLINIPSNKKRFKVRMIDFDSYFCKYMEKLDENDKNFLCTIKLVQLFCFIYEFGNINYLKPFYDNNFFMEVVKNNDAAKNIIILLKDPNIISFSHYFDDYEAGDIIDIIRNIHKEIVSGKKSTFFVPLSGSSSRSSRSSSLKSTISNL